MKSIEQKSNRWVFGLVVGAQCLIPLVIMALFAWRYSYPYRMVGYHGLLVTLGYLALLSAAASLSSVRAVRRQSAARYVLPLAWGSYTVGLYFIYLLAWGGRMGTGMNLTFALVAPYLLRPGVFYTTFGISPATYWGILVGVPAVILLAYAAAASGVSAVLLRLRAKVRRYRRSPLPPARQHRLAAEAIGVLCAGFAMIWLAPPPKPAGSLWGDPILVTLVDTNDMLPIEGSSEQSDQVRRTYAAPAEFQRKNVILIVLDACRADHLGVEGYSRDTTPFLDSLKRTGNLRIVRSFYSASCCTFGGVLTLLRSQNWFKMAPHAFALQDVLKKAGYRVHFVLGGDLSKFHDLEKFYGNSMDSFSDGSSPARHFTLNDDRGVFESFNGVPASDGTPAFIYFHLMSVHQLGQRLPSYVKYTPCRDPHSPLEYTNNHDNGILQADGAIRELFRRLDEKGYLKNSLIVITGDHGDSLGERNTVGHGRNLYAEEVTPPLLIYDPDPVVYRNLEIARQIDVAPTILDRLGLPIPASWDGHSLLREGPQRFSYLRFADTYAVIDHTPARTLKYIYDDRTKGEEVYHLESDPTDEEDIFEKINPLELQQLRAAVETFSVHPGS